jgi:hypothetical protein
MSFLRNALGKALQTYTPRTVGDATYSTAIKAFQLAVEVGLHDAHVQIWTRNGYRGTGWVPFHTPVDLSIWFAREPSARDLNTVRSNYRRVRKIFPVLGEMNLYVATEIELFSVLMNPFELERDPQLKKKIELRTDIHPRARAATFLLRLLDEEIKEVLVATERTERRWSEYFLAVGSVFGDDLEFKTWLDTPGETYLRKILKMVLELIIDPAQKESDAILDCLDLYFQSLGRDVPVETLRPLVQSQPYLWAIFPHRFCFESVKPSLDGMFEGLWAELAWSEISWELSRMLGQSRLFPRVSKPRESATEEALRASMRSHLDSLEEFCQRFLPRQHKASAAVATTVGRIRNLL